MGGGADPYKCKCPETKDKKEKKGVPGYSSFPACKTVERHPVNEISKQAILSTFSHGPHNTGVDVAFSFDTTGSMYPCLEEVKDKLHEIIPALIEQIPGIRIALIAHGDYSDQEQRYVLKIQDFTTSAEVLTAFVQTAGKTLGGDAPEAYELVLRDSLSRLTWGKDHSKALVVIGDEVPHPPSYTDQDIDWRKCLEDLVKAGIKTYGVQVLGKEHASYFYSALSEASGGYHIHLDDWKIIPEMFIAVCSHATSEGKFSEYQTKLKAKGEPSPQVQALLKDLEKPTEKKTLKLQEPWWDRQYDHGKPRFHWDAKANKWVPAARR